MQKNYTKKDLHDPDDHDDVITYLEPDILECEAKWALGSITINKASGGDGIPAELFQFLKDDAVKVLHSRCQQIWKTQQWPKYYIALYHNHFCLEKDCVQKGAYCMCACLLHILSL